MSTKRITLELTEAQAKLARKIIRAAHIDPTIPLHDLNFMRKPGVYVVLYGLNRNLKHTVGDAK